MAWRTLEDGEIVVDQGSFRNAKPLDVRVGGAVLDGWRVLMLHRHGDSVRICGLRMAGFVTMAEGQPPVYHAPRNEWSEPMRWSDVEVFIP